MNVIFYVVQTCKGFPEEYDVFNEAYEQVGSMRLRWGIFAVDYPVAYADTILLETFDDTYKGAFDDNTERFDYLQRGVNAIAGKVLDGIPDKTGARYMVFKDIDELCQYKEAISEKR